MSVLVAVEMTPSKTHAHREAEWLPAFDGHPAHLTIRMRKKQHSREEKAVYGVRENPNPNGREFELTRTTGSQRVTYICVIGREPICTCRAGECKTESCKHRDALMCLVATGEM